MMYTAQPPEPTKTSREFLVTIRAEELGDDEEATEKVIAETVAARLGFETTVEYRVPF